MLSRFLLRWLGNSLGLWVAARLLSGISYDGKLIVIVVAGLVFSIVNALVRPVLVLLSLPAIILTLGFFMLLINGFMLYLVTIIYPSYHISTFSAAVLAVIIVWLVNYAASAVFEGRH